MLELSALSYSAVQCQGWSWAVLRKLNPLHCWWPGIAQNMPGTFREAWKTVNFLSNSKNESCIWIPVNSPGWAEQPALSKLISDKRTSLFHTKLYCASAKSSVDVELWEHCRCQVSSARGEAATLDTMLTVITLCWQVSPEVWKHYLIWLTKKPHPKLFWSGLDHAEWAILCHCSNWTIWIGTIRKKLTSLMPLRPDKCKNATVAETG